MDFGRLLAKVKTLGADRQRWLVIGVVAGVLALVLYAVVRQTPPTKPRPAGPAKQRQVFVPTDLDKKLGVGGLSVEMEKLRQQNSELKRKVEEMETLVKGLKEQKAQAPDLQTFRQEVDRQIHEALQKQLGKLEKQEVPPEKGKAPASGKEWWRELESAGGKQAAAPDKKPAPPPAKPGSGKPADLGKPEAAKPGDIRVVSAKDSQKAGEERASRRKEEPGTYLPSGSIFSGTLLTGVDMPTGEGARRDPLPILLRIKKEAILPNRYRTDVRECFLVASGWGDLSAERAYLRAERLSCIRADGKALENRVEMYAVGEDGKAGVRGRVVNKTGALLGKALVAGFLEGFSKLFGKQPMWSIYTPGTLGRSTRAPFESYLSTDALQSAGLAGAGSAMDRLAKYYIDMAQNIFPVIEVDAGRAIDFILLHGVALKLQQGSVTAVE